MSSTDQSFAVNAPGQSGQLGHQHYDDTALMHLLGQLHPLHFLPKQESANVEGTIHIVPSAQGQ